MNFFSPIYFDTVRMRANNLLLSLASVIVFKKDEFRVSLESENAHRTNEILIYNITKLMHIDNVHLAMGELVNKFPVLNIDLSNAVSIKEKVVVTGKYVDQMLEIAQKSRSSEHDNIRDANSNRKGGKRYDRRSKTIYEGQSGLERNKDQVERHKSDKIRDKSFIETVIEIVKKVGGTVGFFSKKVKKGKNVKSGNSNKEFPAVTADDVKAIKIIRELSKIYNTVGN